MTMEQTGLILSGVAVFIALVAAAFTARTYLLKSGSKLRGSFGISTSVSCDDPYVHSVTLENMKDRAVVVFAIYLRVGPGYFIELENFETEPLVIQPFGAVHREYGPIEFYGGGMRRVRMRKLLTFRNRRLRLVVSTPDGKHVVRRLIQRWNPINTFFKNHMTWVVRPVRSTYRGQAFGSNVKYVAHFNLSDGREEIVPLHERDHEVRRFKKFSIPREALASRDKLEEFLLERVIAGDLPCRDLDVHDLNSWRQEAYEDYDKEEIEALPRNPLTYHVLGRMVTAWENWSLRRQNRKNAAKRKTANTNNVE